jgi:hypothetical protein
MKLTRAVIVVWCLLFVAATIRLWLPHLKKPKIKVAEEVALSGKGQRMVWYADGSTRIQSGNRVLLIEKIQDEMLPMILELPPRTPFDDEKVVKYFAEEITYDTYVNWPGTKVYDHGILIQSRGLHDHDATHYMVHTSS